MFGRKQQPKDAVDVNDFIVNDSMQAGIHIDADLGSPVPSVDIPDDEIIDADYAEPTSRKRLKTSQVLILGAVAVFAVGGVASIFVSPQTPEQKPVSAVSQPPQVAALPEPAAKLPPGLADPDQVQPPANIPGPVANVSGNIAPAATDPVVSSAAPASVPPTLATTATPAPAPVVANATAALPAQITPAVPQVAETKAQPAPTAPASSNPVSAQIAEAQKLSPVTQPVVPAAQPKAPPAPPQTQATPKPLQHQAPVPVPAAPKPAPATATTPNAEKKTVATPKAVAPAQTKQATTERENSEEGIKRLVTTSAESFGLQSIQEGAITLEGRRGNAPQRLHVGDRLPSGEQILRIDARSMTLVTDRSVIRLN